MEQKVSVHGLKVKTNEHLGKQVLDQNTPR